MTMPLDPNVHVGCAAWIERDTKILLMKRKHTSHGGGSWALPGGWVDYGEDPAESAIREVAEEVGIRGLRADLMSVVSNTWEEPAGPGHVICVTYRVAIDPDDEPQILEPDKCSELLWAAPADIAEFLRTGQLFPATQSVILEVTDRILAAVWNPPPYDATEDETQVCLRHGAVNVCRRGSPRDNCTWSDEKHDIKAVIEYQAGERKHWLDWRGGDPCGQCGSTDTWEDAVEGGQCVTCKASDADE